MSNYALDSQEKSVIVQSLLERKKDLSYENFMPKINNTFPSFAKSTVRVSPSVTPSGSIFGASLDFKIPNNGRLLRLALKSTISITADDNQSSVSDSYFGTKMYSIADLRQKGRNISHSDRRHNIAMIQNSDSEQRSALLNTTAISAFPSTATASYTVYTPLDFWFNQDLSTSLDTYVVRDLELHCEIDTAANIFVNSGLSAMVFGSVELICFFGQLDPFYNNELTKLLFKEQQLNVLAYDSFNEIPETLTYASGATLDFTIRPRVKQLISASSFEAWNQTTGVSLAISRIQLAASGQSLVDVYSGEQILANLNKNQGSSDSTNNLTHYYSDSKSGEYFSGALNYDEVYAPVWTVTVDTSSGASSTNVIAIYLNHNITSMLSIDGDSGDILTISQN